MANKKCVTCNPSIDPPPSIHMHLGCDLLRSTRAERFWDDSTCLGFDIKPEISESDFANLFDLSSSKNSRQGHVPEIDPNPNAKTNLA